MSKVTIVGLGLIGSSLGLALRRSPASKTEVVGFDRYSDVADAALRNGAVSRLAPTLRQAVAGADLVVVAVPIINTRAVFEELAPLLAPGVVVTDTASTKVDVLRWASELLPQGVRFVGGHPMAGKTESGPNAADAALFEGRPYCVVAPSNVYPAAVDAVVELARAVGAQPFFLEAAEHDAYAAAISHMPLIASVALFSTARASAAWPELAAMSGPAFRDLTRLASGTPEMAHDICLTNRENLLHWLERYIEQLRRLAALIEGDDAAGLFRALAEAQLERDNFLLNPPQHAEPGDDIDLPSMSETMMDIMVGSHWRERAQEMSTAMEERARARERQERLRRRE